MHRSIELYCYTTHFCRILHWTVHFCTVWYWRFVQCLAFSFALLHTQQFSSALNCWLGSWSTLVLTFYSAQVHSTYNKNLAELHKNCRILKDTNILFTCSGMIINFIFCLITCQFATIAAMLASNVLRQIWCLKSKYLAVLGKPCK